MRTVILTIAGALLGASVAYLVVAFLWWDLFDPFVPTAPGGIFDGTRWAMLVGAIIGGVECALAAQEPSS